MKKLGRPRIPISKATLKALCEAGYTRAEMAADQRASLFVIGSRLIEYGLRAVSELGPKLKLAHITKEMIASRIDAGIRQKDYAAELGVCVFTLNRRAAHFGLRWPKGRHSRGWHLPTTEQRAKFAVYARDECSLEFKRIGMALGLTRQRAYQLYRLGKKAKP